MNSVVRSLIEQAQDTARALLDFGDHLLHPTVRLGVTGMSGAGKTVFIAALVHGLVRGGRFPVFEALATGRLARARLAPQPDDAVPRFDYEQHVRALTEERRWPESTRRISELRLMIDYQSQSRAQRSLTLDIVDYPGEWLLDLPLLTKSYEQWCAESVASARRFPRAAAAQEWIAHLATLQPEAVADEQATLESARLFTAYLKACRDRRLAMSTLAPGRFLMPGDLAGSPALTFAPLELPTGAAPAGSLWAMMRRRYESYKDAVVRPFFRDHFARLDRQVVLIDALAALNAGPEAVRDLQEALAEILECFRVGRKTFLTSLVSPRIDRILVAATKADHLHRLNHDRLEAFVRRLTDRAMARAAFAGAQVDVVALAAVRATREATVRRAGVELASVVGTPQAGETVAGDHFDGSAEAALYPGDLPADPEALFGEGDAAFRGLASAPEQDADYRFLRLRPPVLERTEGGEPALPHIRLDRALQFLIGDRLQ